MVRTNQSGNLVHQHLLDDKGTAVELIDQEGQDSSFFVWRQCLEGLSTQAVTQALICPIGHEKAAKDLRHSVTIQADLREFFTKDLQRLPEQNKETNQAFTGQGLNSFTLEAARGKGHKTPIVKNHTPRQEFFSCHSYHQDKNFSVKGTEQNIELCSPNSTRSARSDFPPQTAQQNSEGFTVK